MTILNKVTSADAERLIELSRAIYKEHYLYLWHPGGAEWYMAEYAYSADKIKNDLTDAAVEYYTATENDSPLGYMKLALTAGLKGFENFAALEVERIYLFKKAMGRGIGKQFMQLAMQRAIDLRKDIVFLKAMDSSNDAIKFYKSLGYAVCGDLQLPMPTFALMKEEFRGMLILKKDLARL
jgi:GNAT superfamily N-acetyltransferase